MFMDTWWPLENVLVFLKNFLIFLEIKKKKCKQLCLITGDEFLVEAYSNLQMILLSFLPSHVVLTMKTHIHRLWKAQKNSIYDMLYFLTARFIWAYVYQILAISSSSSVLQIFIIRQFESIFTKIQKYNMLVRNKVYVQS